ncbi:3-deoxy-D-manno-octulosonic acid kinase [Allopseudospirillum japonicum]|uniref:3-deoxy-D-manno-octulosonic acid kinase n=1 Tax=Allopseudospirillum japonicum TaxID=64971 RepID=A0A1H6UFC1_9GAMM|nr:3-deoxy-D-manno-octulosonic acid kinase [Allopseudospirillum japonicum]SEI88377.1 3-deoxy-D-manno-octulosonic acid kinase [Allopseudospirillum japonicum]
MRIQHFPEQGWHILADEQIAPHIHPSWYQVDHWQQLGLLEAQAQGRGQAYLLKGSRNLPPMVWRHYRRGGLVAKFTPDYYGWTGLKRTRPFREFILTQHLYQAGLPVARPLAAAVKRHPSGLVYQGEFLLERYLETCTLADYLLQGQGEPAILSKVRQVVTEVLAFGLHHVDLNARNILLRVDTQEVFIIDLDACYLRTPAQNWQAQVWQRLARSIDKLSLNPQQHHQVVTLLLDTSLS